MKMYRVALVLFFAGLTFSSCKNQDSKNASTETDILESEEEITIQDSENKNGELVDRIRNNISTKYLSEGDLRAISEDQRKFQFYEIDMNNDGKKEVFVNFPTPYFCGTGGCTLLLLNDQLEPVTEFTVTKTPLYIEKTLENDWRTIMTQSEGKWRKLVYKGGSYPTNPSVVEASSGSPSETADILFPDDNELETYSF